MAVVIIAEKPSVAEDIAKVLGVGQKTDTHWLSDDIVVTWAVGHLLELKTPEEYDDRLKDWRKSVDLLPIIPESFPKSGLVIKSERLPKGVKLFQSLTTLLRIFGSKCSWDITPPPKIILSGEIVLIIFIRPSANNSASISQAL